MKSSDLRRLFFAVILSGVLATGLGAPVRADAPMPGSQVTQTQTTASYSVELDIVPAMQMASSDQAQGAAAPMVMVPMPGMAMSGMSMGSMPMTMATTDDGQPVNHHLGVHIHDAVTGALVSTVMPNISITNEGTGETRTLDDVVAMYGMPAGQSDLHFGNNVYLPDGTYTITVGVGQESALFSHVNVSGGMGLSTNSMAPMNASSTTASP